MINFNIVTTNEDKFKEITHVMKARLGEGLFTFTKVDYLDSLNEIQGDSAEISREKCKEAYGLLEGGGVTIVEDTSFCVDCMNGLPGAYIRDFFLKLGNKGFYTVCENFSKGGPIYATEECYIAICIANVNDINVFKGDIGGTVVQPKNDMEDEYNWNYFFIPNGSENVYGRMSIEEKCELSARKYAILNLCDYLIEKNILKSNNYN
jgi:inosine triphosphate pyrophosphatase